MKQFYFIVCLFLTLSVKMMGQSQSLSISGHVNSANAVTFTSGTAGDIPIVHISDGPPPIILSNSDQSLSYGWPFYGIVGDPNTYIYGVINVRSNVAIPSGLLWTITAEDPSQNSFGISTGVQTLGTLSKTIIERIWSTDSSHDSQHGHTQTASNHPTQELSITNFADLRPTNASGLNITISYTLQ